MAVATAAVVGIAATGASTYMSFSAAAKEKEAKEKADAEAKKALEDARGRAEKDFYGGLAVPLDAYEAEFENNLAVAQQSTEALQEGDARALAAGVGRIGAQSSAASEKARIGMGQEISDLNAMKAQSKDAVNQQLMQMDVAAARDAAQRSRESEAARSAHISQGIQGIGATVKGIGAAAPLFAKQPSAPTTPGGGGQSFSQQASQSQLTTGAGGLMGGNQSAFGSGGGPSLGVNNPFEGLGGFTPSALSPNYFGSDRRLKENIKLIGQSPSGLNIYSFKYKNEEGVYQGVMSDEIDPNAVIRAGEYDMVNYSMIDVEFKKL